MMMKPEYISFPKIGDSQHGYISVAETGTGLPFELKRVFYTYFTPEEIVRGRHAHHHTEMVLVAVAGRIIVNTETLDGETRVFTLDKPNAGVYLPRYCWHTMQYSHNAVQLVLASTLYDEGDYIRDYEQFKQLRKR
jgi:dTDP-4-dehydrorhamnose 3,5-epimerase-like enzyme